MALSGTSGLVGAVAGEALPGESTGAAYLYRGLDNATDTITQTAKLIASDGAIIDEFGYSVSLSGSTGLVGAYDDADPDHGADAGSAYVYRHLDTATGTMTESVKLTASAGETNDHFGASVSVDGDQFIVGSPSGKGIKPLSGIAYTGSVGSLTTLDAGNTAKVISRISFVSREDWIIGQTTDANHVTLSAGDTANITYAGKVVFIGQSTGSDANLLQIAGTLRATTVDIGSLAVNTGNTLQLDSTAAVSIATIHLAPGNRLVIAGDLTAPGALFTYLAAGGTQFKIYQNGIWVALDATNASTRIGTSFASGYTTITPVSVIVDPGNPTPTPKPAAPKVFIHDRKNISHTAKAKLAIRGETTGAVTSVTYRIGTKPAKKAKGTASWGIKAALKPGKNKITITAHGPGGDSAPAKVTVTRKL